MAACIRDRGNAKLLEGDHAGCRRDCLDSLARCRSCGDRSGAAWCLESIGAAALLGGDPVEARTRLTEAVAAFIELDPIGACCSEIELALAHQLLQDWRGSVDACARALDHQRRHRLLATSADLLEVVARLAAELGRWTWAAQLYGAAASWHSAYDTVSWYPLVLRFSLAELVRRELGEPAWIDAHDAGRRLAPDRALALAGEHLAELGGQLGGASVALSLRETEVLRLVAAGCTDLEIAHQLVLSPRTVHAHLRSVYRKLGVGSRTAAVAAAGLVTNSARP